MPDLLLTKPTKELGIHWRSHYHLEEDVYSPGECGDTGGWAGLHR